MTGLRYVVPTYRRAATLAAKTVPTLAAAGVPLTDVEIWLSDPTEREAYAAALGSDFSGRIVDGTATLHGNRNAVMRGAAPGTRLVFVDDDLTAISRRTPDGKLAPVADFPEIALEAFAVADGLGARLWGVYPVHNGFFMKPRTRTDLRYIVGCLYGITVRGDAADLVSLEDKEDFERSLRCYLADGAVVRLEYLAPATRYYREPGGMQMTRTPERIDQGARYLAQAYPQLCTYVTSRAGRPEVVLKDRRPHR